MKNNIIKVVAVVLATLIATTIFPMYVFAIETDNFELVAGSVTVDGTADQTVSVALRINENNQIYGIQGQFTEESDYITLSNYTFPVSLTGMNKFNMDSGELFYFDDTFTGFDVLADTDIVVVEYTVDKDTPTGTYEIQLSIVNVFSFFEFNMTDTGAATYTAEITVTNITGDPDDEESEVTEDYVATLEATTTTVNQGDSVTVNVNVNKEFNSADIVLGYDATMLQFESGALAGGQAMTDKDQAVAISVENGVIRIRDFGSAFVAGAAYTLTFTSLKGGNAEITVTSAGFSTAEEAETKDLIPATGVNASVTINHKVTVNGAVSYVAHKGTYNGVIPNYDPDNNEYNITATMGSETLTVTPDADGKYSISPVTGELTITYTETPNTYIITWSDEDNGVVDGKDVKEVTYGDPVSFKIDAGQAPNDTVDGYHYAVLVYLTADANKTSIATTVDGNQYTIAADKIVGDITIEVTKVVDSAENVLLKVENSDEVYYNGAPITQISVSKNDSYVLTLNKEAGYNYKVELFIGDAETGTELTVNADGTFTVEVGDKAVTIKVTKTLKTDGLVVEGTLYVQLDGAKMWLVKFDTEKIKGKTYALTLNDEVVNFFWSDKYDSYCYLVIDSNDSTAESVQESLTGKVALTDAEAVTVVYDGNVNKTFDAEGNAVIDVNDAQLVWNMYAAQYSNFDSRVDVEKFLRADVDGDGDVDIDDAAYIITDLIK